MKRVSLIIFMVIATGLNGSVFSKQPPTSVILADYDKAEVAFSFKHGLVNEKKAWDVMLDLPHGLGSNNSALAKRFKSGGILDLGAVAFDSVKEVPEKGYVPALKPDEIKVGHSYAIKLSTGKEYGKIFITKFDKQAQVVEFQFELAKNNGRSFQ